MARLTVEDCLKKEANRFELIMTASKRARELERGMEASIPWENDKPTVLALREIAENLITEDVLNEAVIKQDDVEALIEGDLQAIDKKL